MVPVERIEGLAKSIGDRFPAERVILFGSYAYGTPTDDSDVDLLVVMPFTGKAAAKAAEIRAAVHLGFPLDIIAIQPERLAERLAKEDFFLREAVEKGRLLYEAGHA
jgi:predicted nucleotidyltransferase